MRIHLLRFTFLVLSILAVESAVTGCSDQDDPNSTGKQSVTSQDRQVERIKRITVSQVTEATVKEKEKKNIKLTDETGTPFDKMPASQIAQIKRYDCRLRKKILPHDYKR
ncbi:MAG: hypothetical protein D3914_07530 [Candidatus Electrothrix sp. LOE2]|nr:hypothetical protein [Candidatus Electrothrix sp. LOE2]